MDLQKKKTAQELIKPFSALVDSTLGDMNISVSAFEGPDSQIAESFCFINNPRLIEKAEQSQAVCIAASANLKDKVEALNSSKTWIFSKNVDLLAREIKKAFVLNTPYKAGWQGVHPTAVIGEGVEMGEQVTVGPYAVIAENTKIGNHCFIGSHTVIEANVSIGNNVTLHPHAYIGHSCEIGDDCEIMPQAVVGSEGYGYVHDHLGNHYRIPHSGKLILGKDVHIGGASCVDRGTLKDAVIGDGTKIDNHVHLAHNTVVGKNGLITAHVVIAGSTTIGDNFVVGGNSSITGHINITDNVQLAGNTGVANDIRQPGAYGFYPAIPLKQALKVRASSVHLPEMRKQLNKVMKKLFPED